MKPETIQSVLRTIAHCDDAKQCVEIIRTASQRRDVLNKRTYESLVADAWERARTWTVGLDIWVCASGTFIGGDLQRGDKLTVTAVQPRKKLVWASKPGAAPHQFGFPPAQVHRYELKVEPPDNPLPQAERAIVNDISARITSVL